MSIHFWLHFFSNYGFISCSCSSSKLSINALCVREEKWERWYGINTYNISIKKWNVCMYASSFLFVHISHWLWTCFWLLQISPVDVWMTCILKLSRAYFQEVQPYPLEGHSSWIFWLLLSRKWPFHCLWTVHPLGPGHISPGPELWVWVGSHLCPVPITEENITTDPYWLIKSGLITSLSLASAKSLTDISFSSDCWKCWAPVNT